MFLPSHKQSRHILRSETVFHHDEFSTFSAMKLTPFKTGISGSTGEAQKNGRAIEFARPLDFGSVSEKAAEIKEPLSRFVRPRGECRCPPATKP